VVHGPDGKSATYAELASEAARKPVPTNVRLKNAGELRLVGKGTRRLDSRPKCDGSLKFGLDLDLPGMKVAVVAHPPVFGARVKSVVDTDARAVEGVRDVFEIPLSKGTGVAVVADKFWPAKQARSRLKIEWDLSGVEAADSSELWTRYKQLSRTPGNVALNQGDEKVLDKIPEQNRIIAEYEFPYLPHSPMEPLNTTVRFDGDRAEVWAGSQFQTVDQMAIAEVLGLEPQRVTFHTEMAGGGFGRIDAFQIEDMAFEEIDLRLHAIAGVGHALFGKAGLGLQLAEPAQGLADHRLGAADNGGLRGLADVAGEQACDHGGSHGEFADAVVIGAGRGLGGFAERNAADDLLVGGIRPVGLPARAHELRHDIAGDEAVHLGGGDVGGERIALRKAEIGREGSVERSLGG